MLAPIVAILLWAAPPDTASRFDADPLMQGAGLTITFTPVDAAGAVLATVDGDALIDLGRIVGAPGRTRATSTIIRRDVAIRIVSSSGATGIAALAAWLQADNRRAHIRIDGRLISNLPQIIDAGVVVGIAVRHSIEFEVPYSEPAGPLVSTITWRAERRIP
jgi:hypothetical protein